MGQRWESIMFRPVSFQTPLSRNSTGLQVLPYSELLITNNAIVQSYNLLTEISNYFCLRLVGPPYTQREHIIFSLNSRLWGSSTSPRSSKDHIRNILQCPCYMKNKVIFPTSLIIYIHVLKNSSVFF